LNDFREDFSEDDFGCEEDDIIKIEEMFMRLIFQQFFDSYFDNPVFYLDIILNSLRKFSKENTFDKPDTIKELDREKLLLVKLGERRKIRIKLKRNNEIRRSLL
jgi:hypothetical protein